VGNAGTKVVFRTNYPASKKKVVGFLRGGSSQHITPLDIEQLPEYRAFVDVPQMNKAVSIRMHPLLAPESPSVDTGSTPTHQPNGNCPLSTPKAAVVDDAMICSQIEARNAELGLKEEPAQVIAPALPIKPLSLSIALPPAEARKAMDTYNGQRHSAQECCLRMTTGV
jgi:hypothetical protein